MTTVPTCTAPSRQGCPDDGEPLIKQVSRFVQAVADIVAGDRPCTQVMGVADPQVYELLTRRAAAAASRRRAATSCRRHPPRIVSVRVVCHRPGVAEISARVRHGERSRCLAARMEHARGRWVCTALDIG